MLQREHKKLILSVIFGSILEWHEVFAYIYWAPVLAKLFLPDSLGETTLIYTIGIFSCGLVSRPFGGPIFGFIGDRYGRKVSFLASILIATFPSICAGFLPIYSQAGIISISLLAFFRIIQGFPAGGELPGAMCYLVESSPIKSKRFVSSFSFIGAQIGGIIGIFETTTMERFLSQEFLFRYGWRISFIIGGLIGFTGIFLRSSLEETPLFEELKKKHHNLQHPVHHAWKTHKLELLLGFFYSILEVVGYYLVAVFPAIYFQKVLNIPRTYNLLLTAIILSISAITIPYFGKLGDRFNNKKLLILRSVLDKIFFTPRNPLVVSS